MHPNKLRNLLPSFAMEMNRPVEEVEAVTNFFYKTLRTKLSALESATVHVHNLGNFYIKENALDSTIEKYNCVLEKLHNYSIHEYGVKRNIHQQVEQMRKMKELLNEERLRRRSIINKRFNNESEGQRDSDMEEQKPYSRRCNE